ncbi:hypothetical protein O9X80_05555 [Agrobacterium salinitolerans]|uniref:hypothetical protein n=1 Tax=Agrobacterium salinitolerans TaxID=1183413 RepID=UPI0022B82840|nr:hypothetical protein [Agrobacterium salinitolerans]MCZ7973958.1 hypothetical protein [Agrobacterium salinitolerans]
MKTTTTTIRGLAIDVLVIETMQQTASGEVLWYVATILVQNRRTGVKRLVRRTRVPGSGKELAKAVQQRGVRALEALAAA